MKETATNEKPATPHTVRLPKFLIKEEVGLGQVVKRITASVGLRPCAGRIHTHSSSQNFRLLHQETSAPSVPLQSVLLRLSEFFFTSVPTVCAPELVHETSTSPG